MMDWLAMINVQSSHQMGIRGWDLPWCGSEQCFRCVNYHHLGFSFIVWGKKEEAKATRPLRWKQSMGKVANHPFPDPKGCCSIVIRHCCQVWQRAGRQAGKGAGKVKLGTKPNLPRKKHWRLHKVICLGILASFCGSHKCVKRRLFTFQLTVNRQRRDYTWFGEGMIQGEGCCFFTAFYWLSFADLRESLFYWSCRDESF